MGIKFLRFEVSMMDIQSLLLIAGSFLTACSDSNDDPVEPQPGQETITGDDASDKAQYKVTQTAVIQIFKNNKMGNGNILLLPILLPLLDWLTLFLLPIQGFVGERSVIEREQKPLLLVAVARPPSFRPLHITSGVALLNDKYQRQLMIFISPDKNTPVRDKNLSVRISSDA